MKEYICKKDLMSKIESESRMWGEDYDAHQILGDIEDISTVTKADICREFVEKMRKHNECMNGSEVVEVWRMLDTLEKMESDE